MPKIRWNGHTKIQNKALGLPGPDVAWANPGAEMTVDDKTLKAIEARYGAAAFEVVEDTKTAGTTGKGKKA